MSDLTATPVRKDEFIGFRVPAELKKILEDKAKGDDRTLSDYFRLIAIREAKNR